MAEGGYLANQGILGVSDELEFVTVGGQFVVLHRDSQCAAYGTATGHGVAGQSQVLQFRVAVSAQREAGDGCPQALLDQIELPQGQVSDGLKIVVADSSFLQRGSEDWFFRWLQCPRHTL
jgi:hypothetical protein